MPRESFVYRPGLGVVPKAEAPGRAGKLDTPATGKIYVVAGMR